MLNVANNPFMLSVVVLIVANNPFMLNVANNPFMLNVVAPLDLPERSTLYSPGSIGGLQRLVCWISKSDLGGTTV